MTNRRFLCQVIGPLVVVPVLATAAILWLAGNFSAHAVYAQGNPIVTPADVTGDGSQHSITIPGGTRWIEVITSSSNASVVRVGDANTACGAYGTGRGLPLAAGGAQLLPPSFAMAPTLYYCAASGDKFAYAYGN